MAYPSAISSFTTKIDDVHDVMAADVNNLQTDVVNIETELGTDPAGTVTDVKTRLARSLDGVGNVNFTPATLLTIAGGVVAPTQNFHAITTQASATTDDLDTITDVADGFVLLLHINADNRQVRIRHATGNIACAGRQDIWLLTTGDTCLLVQDDTLGVWCASYVGRRPPVILSKTTAYTAAIGDDIVLCDATGAAFTVTLPAAATSSGMVVAVKKIDASANAITIDANASETIDGVTTKQLVSQWQSLTIACDGSAWFCV
jgi:hypothetical protein